jgi:hypothetical protein
MKMVILPMEIEVVRARRAKGGSSDMGKSQLCVPNSDGKPPCGRENV